MTILESLFTTNNVIDNLNKKNSTFFSEYLNKDIIIDLINIKNNYLKIVNFDKYNEFNMLESEISNLYKSYNGLRRKQIKLLKMKTNLIKQLVNKDNIDIINTDYDINKKLASLVEAKTKLKMKINERRKKISNLKNNQSKDDLINKLKDEICNLEDPLIAVSMLYSLKSKYSTFIKDIVFNEKCRNCYINYLFEMISNDVETLKHFYDLAYKLVNKEYFDKLDNMSVLLEQSLNNEQNKALNNFVKIISSKDISNNILNEISDEYFKNKTLINAMMHYAKNYKTLFYNNLLNSEYNVIKEMTLDIEKEKNDIDSTLHNIVNNNSKLKLTSLNDIINIYKSFNKIINHHNY